MYAKGITDDNRFITQALSSLREFMQDDGQEFIYQRLIAPACGSIRFAKALDRSVTGSLNDLIYHASMLLIEYELAPHDVGFKLNEIQFSTLGYANPREAFKSLLATPVSDPTRNP